MCILQTHLLMHVIRTPPDPDGQNTTTGPAGPYFEGGPVCPAHSLLALKSCKHLISDHADPVVQREAKSDTTELLEYKVVENILDGRPTKGIAWSELLECSIRLLDSSLNGKLEEEIFDWEPEASPLPETSLGSGHMRILCLVPSEQFVPDSCSVVRALVDATEEDLIHKSVMSPVQDNDPDGQLHNPEYDNPRCVRRMEETQVNNDTGLSDQELEEDMHHQPVMSPVQDNDPDGQLREVKDYDNPRYVRKLEERQGNNDTGLSDRELEEEIHHQPVMSPVQDNDPDGQLKKEYDYHSYMKRTEKTQFSYNTELSDQDLEDAI